jgi:hypothetical protein
MNPVQAAQLLATGVKKAAANPTVRKAAAGIAVSGALKARERMPDVYRARSPIVAVTGLPGTGKTVLVHQLCTPKSEYRTLPYESVVVEKKSVRFGLQGMRFRVVPGGEVASRQVGFRQLFHDEPVDGVIHVVADGLATARPGSPAAAIEGLGLDGYRALQREREVEDFRDTAAHIASLVSASARPVWLLVAVTKTDLLHPDIATDVVENYYSLHGHSPFATELRDLRRMVGDGNLTTAVMPVYAMAEDFTYRGETVRTRGSVADRDDRLDRFRHRLRHLTGQIS